MPSRTVHLLGIIAVALAMLLFASHSQASPRIAVPAWDFDSVLALDTSPWPSWSATDDEDEDDHGDRHDDEDDDCDDDHDGDHDDDHGDGGDSGDDGNDDDGKGGSVAVERTSWSVLKGAY